MSDMLDLIEKEVKKIQEMKYSNEKENDLQFDVGLLIPSIDCDDEEDYCKILLSINHHGTKLSRVIFPKDSHFASLDLKEEVEYLYNATM